MSTQHWVNGATTPSIYTPCRLSRRYIRARTRDTPTQHLPHPLLPIHPTLCRSTPTRKSITNPTPAAAALIFYQRRRENLQKYPGAHRHQRGPMQNTRIDEIIHDTCQSIHFFENRRLKIKKRIKTRFCDIQTCPSNMRNLNETLQILFKEKIQIEIRASLFCIIFVLF